MVIDPCSPDRPQAHERLDGLLATADQARNSDAAVALAVGEEAYALALELDDPAWLARALNNLGRTLWALGDYPTAHDRCRRALTHARRAHDVESEVRSLMTLGLIDLDQAKFSLAIPAFLKALALSRTHDLRPREGGCLNNLGGAYQCLGDYGKAIDYYLQARHLLDQHGSIDDKIIIRVNLGATCQNLGRLGEAMAYFQEAHRLASASGNTRYQGEALMHRGLLYGHDGDLALELRSLQEALACFQQARYRKGEAEAYNALGVAHARQGELDVALRCFSHAMDIVTSTRDRHVETSTRLLTGTTLLDAGDLTAARTELEHALGLAEALGLAREARDVHQALSTLHERVGAFELALHHHKQLHAFQQRLFNEDLDRRTKVLLVEHEVEQAQQRARVAEKEAELQRLRNEELARALRDLERVDQERQALFAQLAHQAEHDPLTGLPNRTRFQARLNDAIHQARRQGSRAAVLFLDVDAFKRVNDTLGHDAGDQLLIEVARRLQGSVGPRDTVARWGGDEFTVVLPEVCRSRDVNAVAGAVLSALSRPVQLGERTVELTVSLGIAVFPDDAHEPALLLRHADSALSTAKHGGKNTWRRFGTTAGWGSPSREVSRELRRALDQDEIRIDVQEIVDVSARGVVGREVRPGWTHPTLGPLDSGAVLRYVEESGTTPEFATWLLARAFRDASRWSGDVALHLDLGAALVTPELPTTLHEALAATGMDATRLVVEVAEPDLMRDVSLSCSVLQAVRRLGARVYVDGFGLGTASLPHLRRLPVSGVKLDASLVHEVESPSGRAIVRSLVEIARAHDLTVTALAVDRDPLVTALLDCGIRVMQGDAVSAGVSSVPSVEAVDTRGFSELTVREREVLAFLVQGESNKGIARALGLSEFTVRNHLRRVFEKLGVSSRTQAVNVALSRRLV